MPARVPHWEAEMNRAVCSPLIAAILVLAWCDISRAQGVRSDFYATNGVVQVSSLVGNLLYVGGDFSWVGFPTGPGTSISTQTGDPTLGFPRIAGSSPVV